MILSKGSYDHQDNSVWFRHAIQQHFSQVGHRERYVERYLIRGTLTGTSASDLTDKMQSLRDAYADPSTDLVFKDNNSADTHHKLLAGDTVNGVQTKQLQWLDGNPGVWGSGTEYVNKRSFQIIVEAEVLNGDINVLLWHESVEQIGDGSPRWKLVGSLAGPVQRQDIQQFTPFTLLQRGYAIGQLAEPIPPPAIAPGAVHADTSRISAATPQRFGVNVNTHFPIRWHYVMESATALTGGPNLF